MNKGLNMGKYMQESNDHIISWIDSAPGEFNIRDIELDFEKRFILEQRFERMVQIGYIERVGRRRGWYRKIESDCEKMDFINASDSPVDLWLPLRLSDYIQTHSGNILIVAGCKSSGKTAFLLNTAKENMMKDWDVNYFSSEMDAGELKLRLKKFSDISIDQWRMNAYRRGGDFQDVIKPGTNSLNIIDFLEVHDEFYVVGRRLKEIHDKLKGAVAIIGLQKNPGQDTGLGGWRSMEVCRMAIALEYGTCKITEGKNWADPEKNPVGWKMNFKLVDGCRIIPGREGWQRETRKGDK